MTVRILVADDQPLVSAGIGAVLDAEPDLEVIACTRTASVVQAAGEHAPDVVVIDVPPDDADLIGKVLAGGAVRVLVLSTRHDLRLVRDMLVAGAAGYVLKDHATETLADVVRLVATGSGTVLGPAIVDDLLDELSSQPVSGSTAGLPDPLTRREQEVLVLIAQGLSNTEIGSRLFISSLTARTHVGRVIMKLGARNRAHAVTTAYRTGLIRLPRAA
jgi:DNA-binding NarL/FixJ family response regulator